MAECERCGSEFDRKPGELWKRHCLTCWTELKNGNGNERLLLTLEERVSALEVQVIWLMYQTQKKDVRP